MSETEHLEMTTQTTTAPLPQGGNTPSKKQEKKIITGSIFSDRILRDIVYFVLTVMFIGVATMFVATITLFVQSFNSKQASYEDLKDQVMLQNSKIDALTQELQK